MNRLTEIAVVALALIVGGYELWHHYAGSVIVFLIAGVVAAVLAKRIFHRRRAAIIGFWIGALSAIVADGNRHSPALTAFAVVLATFIIGAIAVWVMAREALPSSRRRRGGEEARR